jgi:uncharacterized protein
MSLGTLVGDMNRLTLRRPILPIAVLAAATWFPSVVRAQLEIDLERPGPREFVVDKAGLLDQQTEEQVRGICDKLLTDKAIPIIVVTINSMAEHSGGNLRIETFARLLFDQWQIGHAKLQSSRGGRSFSWNNGILLLISKQDRKARIELGADWGREKDQLCQQIMEQRIVPKFKQSDFDAGVLAGVQALDAMAREKELPKIPRPWWHYALIVGFIGLAIFTAVSLYRRGASGWAWVFWAAIFALLGYLLYSFLTSSGRGSGGGGGFGGGSFGGGFSGGGGATGSW